MPTSTVRERSDVPACESCGKEAAFRDATGGAVCEFCPAVDYGIDRGREAACAEIGLAVLTASVDSGTPPIDLHALVDEAVERNAVETPSVPTSIGRSGERLSEGPWLKGLTPITGRGEAIVATRRGGAR